MQSIMKGVEGIHHCFRKLCFGWSVVYTDMRPGIQIMINGFGMWWMLEEAYYGQMKKSHFFSPLLYCDKWIYYSNLRFASKCVFLFSIGLDALRATVSLSDHLQRNTFIKREPVGAPSFQSTYYSSFLRTNWATGFDCESLPASCFCRSKQLVKQVRPAIRNWSPCEAAGFAR